MLIEFEGVYIIYFILLSSLMYILIILLPLLGALIGTNGYCGNRLGPRISVLCMMVATLLSIVGFIEVG